MEELITPPKTSLDYRLVLVYLGVGCVVELRDTAVSHTPVYSTYPPSCFERRSANFGGGRG